VVIVEVEVLNEVEVAGKRGERKRAYRSVMSALSFLARVLKMPSSLFRSGNCVIQCTKLPVMHKTGVVLVFMARSPSFGSGGRASKKVLMIFTNTLNSSPHSPGSNLNG
jgi:hypothetical protein